MRSLRARLLAWLLAPLLFMSGAHLASTWLDTRKTAEGIFDKLLVTLALSISEHALASGGDLLTEELLELIRITTNDHLYYKVIGPGGAFITGYEDLPEPAGGIGVAQNNLQFYDALYTGKAVRVIAVSSLIERPEYSGWMTTFVAQTKNERAAWVESILLQNLWRVALMIAIASGLLSVGVWLGLRPLARLQHAVHQRTSADLSPIPCRKLPREISALVSELNDLLARLQAHMQFTRRFVENAAHQLRTPVTALLPQAELAWRKAESARDKTAIGKIKTSAENLARLTHQLLNMARAESIALGGPPAASRRDFSALDLADLAARRIAAFCELYPEIEVVADLQAARARGMALFIGEALDNLLDNARKYGRPAPGPATITVRSFCRGDRSILEVSDRGGGFPKQHYKAATERFVRLVDAGPGSGLGLAIVREIVEAHGGELCFRSLPDGFAVGCAFPRLLPEP